MNLYSVKLKGMTGYSAGTVYGYSYVVAEDPRDAYDKVLKFLVENNIGYDKDRVLDSITLLAESCRYPKCQTMLFL